LTILVYPERATESGVQPLEFEQFTSIESWSSMSSTILPQFTSATSKRGVQPALSFELSWAQVSSVVAVMPFCGYTSLPLIMVLDLRHLASSCLYRFESIEVIQNLRFLRLNPKTMPFDHPNLV
jgi:hypothetical protein